MYFNRKLRVSRKGKGVELLAENSVGAGAGIAQRSRLKQKVKGGGTASDSNGTEGKVRRVFMGCQVEPKRRGGGVADILSARCEGGEGTAIISG